MYTGLSLRVCWIRALAVSAVILSLQSSTVWALTADSDTGQSTAPVQGAPVKEPIKERCQLLAEADKFAIEQLGFEDADKNGIPDYREKYVLNVTDCSTVSAQFDWILEQMAKNGALDPNQGAGACQLRGGNHAANLVPEIGIVDVTPSPKGASDGQCWYSFPSDTIQYPQGFPDPFEKLDPAYDGPVGWKPAPTTPTAVVTPAPTVPVIVPVQPEPPVCVRPRQKGCLGRILRPRRR
jgi:hypothetical protein